MTNRIAPFALMSLATAISMEAQAQVTSVTDNLAVTANQSTPINLTSNDLRTDANGGPLPFPQVFVTFNYSGNYFDSSGQQIDPFDGSQTEDFVILNICSDDLAHGSASITASGQLNYTPDEGYIGDDSMGYYLEEYLVTDGVATYEDSDYNGIVNLAIAQQETTLTDSVTGRNRKQVAAAVTNMCDAGNNQLSTDLQQRCAELDDIAASNPQSLQGIIGQLTPDEVLALRRLASNVSRQHTDQVYRQIQLRTQRTVTPDITLNDSEFSAYNLQGGNAGGESISPWSSFAAIQYDATDFNGDDLEDPYETETASLTMGADYRLSSSWILGLALAWSEQDVTYNKTAGTLDASLYNLIGYASYMGSFINLDLQLGYLQSDQDIERNIQYSGLDTSTNANTDTEVFSLSTQLDWNWSKQSWNLRPYLRLDYLRAQIDGFQETGGMGWAVAASDQDMAQWTTSLGLDTTYAASYSWGVLVPGFNLSANSQASKDYRPVQFHFVDDGSSAGDFTLLSNGEDALFYQYEINAVAIFTGGASAYFSYRGSAEFDDMESNQIALGGRYEF